MEKEVIGFVIWALVGCAVIAIGIISFFSKKAVGFWANIDTFQVNDVKKYNHATGRLFIVYGVIFIALGIPMLSEDTSYILFSIVGVMIETIVMMAVYSLVITTKYKKQ